jgi:hypothetical protein
MINKGGGHTTFHLLPEHRTSGNGHMRMDRNNLQVADVIQKWILDTTR